MITIANQSIRMLIKIMSFKQLQMKNSSLSEIIIIKDCVNANDIQALEEVFVIAHFKIYKQF